MNATETVISRIANKTQTGGNQKWVVLFLILMVPKVGNKRSRMQNYNRFANRTD